MNRAVTALPFLRPRVVEVACTIDVENTFDSLHAYVELDGLEVGPGDRVTVHGAPTDIGHGELRICRGTATVERAGLVRRLAAYLEGYLELTELYEVGFSEGRSA